MANMITGATNDRLKITIVIFSAKHILLKLALVLNFMQMLSNLTNFFFGGGLGQDYQINVPMYLNVITKSTSIDPYINHVLPFKYYFISNQTVSIETF